MGGLQVPGFAASITSMTRKPPSSTLESAAFRYLSERRGRPAWSGPPRAGKAVNAVLRPLARKFGPGLAAMTEHWPEIVGERLAAWCAPQALRGGVLTIRARGPAGAVIEAEQRRILQRVAVYCGGRAPDRIRVVQGAARKPPAQLAARSQMRQGLAAEPDERIASGPERPGGAMRARRDEPET